MPREFKIGNCWKGRKLLLKMYLTEKCLAIFYQTLKKCKQMCKDEKCKIGPLSHFIEKTERKKVFQKVKKVKDLECRVISTSSGFELLPYPLRRVIF